MRRVILKNFIYHAVGIQCLAKNLYLFRRNVYISRFGTGIIPLNALCGYGDLEN